MTDRQNCTSFLDTPAGLLGRIPNSEGLVPAFWGNTRPCVFAMIATRDGNGPCRGLFQLIKQPELQQIHFVLGTFLAPNQFPMGPNNDASLHGLDLVTLRHRSRYDLSLISQARRAVREHGVTILQSHGYKAALVAWCLKQLTGLPWVAFAHGYTRESLRMSFYNRLDKWLMRKADRVLVVSRATGHLFRHAGVPEACIRVVPNAIDPPDHSPWDCGREFRRSCGVLEGHLLVGVIGRLSPEKGQEKFLRAFKEVIRAVPQAKGVLVGEGSEMARLRALTRSLHLEAHVTFAGNRSDMADVYAGLDLVVIPSLSEGMPNVLLETMVHGRPTVATNVGGIPEVMQGSLSQWLVPAGNVPALAQTIVSALRAPDLRAELGALGSQLVRKMLSPSRRAQQVAGVYKELTPSFLFL